jgi:ubiquinone/menaquinone biosynthesis C-methylase UbiE
LDENKIITPSIAHRPIFVMSGANHPKPQYDAFATSYDLVWTTPAVAPLLPLLKSTISSLGPLTGASVLDLATGTGIGLRLVRAAGASKLVGVDISPQMLEIAQATTPGAVFHTADCSKPLDELGLEAQSFDVVLGIWLLNQSPSAAELGGMWANIARYLKPGGSFVGITENHNIVHPVGVQTFKYGAKESNITELENGQGWSVHIEFQTEPKIEINGFRLKKEIFEAEAKNAGMGEITYHAPGMEHVRETSSDGGVEEEAGWWDELLEEPPNFVIVAQKL